MDEWPTRTCNSFGLIGCPAWRPDRRRAASLNSASARLRSPALLTCGAAPPHCRHTASGFARRSRRMRFIIAGFDGLCRRAGADRVP